MPTGQSRSLGDRGDELVSAMWRERPGGVVQQHARGAEVRELAGLLDERLRLAGRAGAVDEAGVELLVPVGDRLTGFAQVLDVVERVVEAEHVDPALRRTRHEAPRKVAADRAGPHEEATAEGEAERRRRPRLERPDSFPGALDAAANGAVEDAAAGHLEVREPRAVEDLGELEHRRRRQPARERLLRKQANGRVDERWHAVEAEVKPAKAGTSAQPWAVAHP